MPYEGKSVNIMGFMFKSPAVALFQPFLSSVYNVLIESYVVFLTFMPTLVRILIFSTPFTLNNMSRHYLTISSEFKEMLVSVLNKSASFICFCLCHHYHQYEKRST